MWNLYGPTETNVCTAHRVVTAPHPDSAPVPIGRPVAGDRARIVGDDGEPVAPGTIGELVVSGPTVALGYRNAPDLTAARFTVDASGVRSYRTGDRVVEAHDGTLSYIGRTDDQVKTRGHRVELGEVEVALLQHPDVSDGAVVAVPDELVTNRLVAFVELVPSSTTTSAEIMRHVAARLPSPMVPERVDVVRLPRTSTGKIDRAGLVRSAQQPA
jgi:acyl-coenzyme A synthetase/AMP-(fatty) acid ligase